ncbi:MAG: hypothetical protein HY696_03485 [Deltaproteobacteria bacterium]|nr:hypothetical protein [Deltaproteobacteria bacterium]
MTSYLAPAADLFPSVLATAFYDTHPQSAYGFVSAYDFFYWGTIRRALRHPYADRHVPNQAGRLLQQFGRLLEADDARFTTFADQTADTLVPYSLGEVPHPPLDPATQRVARAAIEHGLPQCGATTDGATIIAIPCYAYGTLLRPDLEAHPAPDQWMILQALRRSFPPEYREVADDPQPLPEPSCPPLLGVMLARRPAGAELLSQLAWQRALYCAAYSAQVFVVAAAQNRLPPIATRSVLSRPSTAPNSWQAAIPHYFTRATMAEQLGQLGQTPSPANWRRFLARAYTQLGFGHPAKLHPKRLYERLGTYQHAAELLAMTEATRQTATSWSMTALTEEWLATLRNVMGGVTQVIPDAPMVVFAASQDHGEFTIQHALDAALTPDQEEAFIMAALWTAIQGEPLHDTPADQRLLFGHLRTAIDIESPIVAIPVYNWRILTGSEKEWPDLHGVFFGMRHPDAAPPSPAMWCAWVLAAQYLLSPLAAAVDGKKAPYTPTDVERSLDTSSRQPFDPRSGKDQHLKQLMLEMNEQWLFSHPII